MERVKTNSGKWLAYLLALGMLGAPVGLFAQQQPPAPPQDQQSYPPQDQDQPPAPPQDQQSYPPQDQPPAPPQDQQVAPPQQQPPDTNNNPGWRRFSTPPQGYPPQAYPQGQGPQYQAPPPAQVPPRITIPAGTYVTVRVDQYISSDKNQVGDGFSATLARPIVAGGVVVARRGEIIGGRVAEVKKAGRVTGVSHLAVQLTSVTLVDGQQVPIETELTSFKGPTSNGRDAAAMATTTVMGAAIGAAADLGPGAAIGAGAGLIAGTVGVLVTRGRPTVIYPESMLTFRIAQPVAFSTDRAPQAFAYVNQGPPPPSPQYGQQPQYGPQTQYGPPNGNQNYGPPTGYQNYGDDCGPNGCPQPASPGYYPPPYYPYYYGYYPYYWGPGFSFWYGPRYYGGWGYGRGYYGGHAYFGGRGFAGGVHGGGHR